MIGFPGWSVMLFGFLGFLLMGGLQFFKLVYRTFPRDLWCALYRVLALCVIENVLFRMGSKLVEYMRAVKRCINENLYVTDFFQNTVKKHPSKIALMFEDTKVTFQELDDISNRIANALTASTPLQHGDTMAILMENCPEYVYIQLALSKLGVTYACINYNLRGDSLAHCIRIANCSGLFFGSSFSDAVSEVLPNLNLGDMLYFVGSECSLPQAKSLETAMKVASSNTPPPVKGKSAHGTTFAQPVQYFQTSFSRQNVFHLYIRNHWTPQSLQREAFQVFYISDITRKRSLDCPALVGTLA
jgi:hypothetical protein